MTTDSEDDAAGESGRRVEQPASYPDNGKFWGSDALALTLRDLEIPFVAFNPGASCRGLQDSIVNHLGNIAPQLLLCLHEESAVAIAQGYWKVAGKPMAALLHSNVGLMHATMAVFNAWCDRAPVLLLGATGPWDADRRRPWIDWLHTSSDQGALIRDYTKWDNQPGSVPAACEALIRAKLIACTEPRGPTYVNLDQVLQEEPIAALPSIKPASFAAPSPTALSGEALARIAAELAESARPLIMIGRTDRSQEAWDRRVALAEALDADVLTDIKMPAAFPTAHRLHAAPPSLFLPPEAIQAIRDADVILSLDWQDLAGALKQALPPGTALPKIVNISPDAHIHRGWSMDYFALAPASHYCLASPDEAVRQLLDVVQPRTPRPRTAYARAEANASAQAISLDGLGAAAAVVMAEHRASLLRVPIGWSGRAIEFSGPLDYIGLEGGGGVGAGPGLAIGAALALRDSGRLPLAIMGDGDFLMGLTALWTAAHYRIPLLIVVVNNQSYFIDEGHQERVARVRGRAVANKWIGQRIADPEVDIGLSARAQGALTFEVHQAGELLATLREAARETLSGKVVVVDVRVVTDHAH